MKLIRFVLLVAMFGYVNQVDALSQRNVKILTVGSGVTAATLGLIILHGYWLKNSGCSILQKIGFDILTVLIAGGGAGTSAYYLLRQCTPEYKIALAEFMRGMVIQDPFYANMVLRSSEDFLVISSLYFGPRETKELAHEHINVLQKQLDDANLLITQAFSEIKSNREATLLRNKCMNLIKEFIAMKQKLNNTAFTIPQNCVDHHQQHQQQVVPDGQETRKIRSILKALSDVYA